MNKRIIIFALILAILAGNYSNAFALKGGENIALNKPVTCDSVYSNLEAYSGSRAVDGNINTMWSQGFSGKNGYIQIDLLKEYQIGQIVVAPRWNMDSVSSRQNFELRLSNDSKFLKYETVYVQGNDPLEWRTLLKVDVKSKTAYRYVRLQKTDTGNCVISEIEVYATPESAKDFSNADYEKELLLSDYLGFVNKNDFNGENFVTRGDLTELLVNYAGFNFDLSEKDYTVFTDVDKNHKNFRAIQIACSAGWIKGDENGRFKPNEYVRYSTMLEMLLYAMDCGDMLQYMDFNSVCRKFKLYPQQYNPDKFITYADVVCAIYKSLKAEYPIKSYSKNGMVKYSYDGTDFLKKRFNVSENEGVVTQIKVSNLAVEGTFIQAEIDDVKYIDKTEKLQDYLGYKVEYFTDKENCVVAFSLSDDNDERAVVSNCILDGTNLKKKRIEAEINGKRHKFNLESGYSIIYNGAAYHKEDDSLLKTENTKVRLLDNNDNGIIDVVFIDTYKSYMIKSVAADKYTINMTTEDGSYLIFDNSSDIITEIFTKEGSLISVDMLESGDIIDVWRSIDGRRNKIIAVMHRVEGIVDSLYEDEAGKHIELDGEIYSVNSVTDRNLQNNSKYSAEIKVGLTGMFYLNSNGEIAAIDVRGYNSFEYAYYLKSAVLPGIDETVQIKVFTSDGDMKIYELDEKVIIDQKRYKLSGSLLSELEPSMVKIRVTDDVVKEIDTLDLKEENGETINNSLTLFKDNTSVYNSSMKTLYKTDGYKMVARVNTESPLFIVPVDNDNNILTDGFDKYWKVVKVGSVLQHKYPTKITDFYCLDRTTKLPEAYAKYTLVSAGQNTAQSVENTDPTMLIGRVIHTIDEDGDDRLRIIGYGSGGEVGFYVDEDIYFTYNDEAIYPKDLKMGDIVHYTYMNDTITGFKVIFRYDGDKDKMESKGSSTSYVPWYTVGSGTSRQMVADTRAFYSIMINKNDNLISLVDRFPETVPEDEYFLRTEIYDVGTAKLYEVDKKGVRIIGLNELNMYNWYVNSSARVMLVSKQGQMQYVALYNIK